jgi:hypothetical protein
MENEGSALPSVESFLYVQHQRIGTETNTEQKGFGLEVPALQSGRLQIFSSSTNR